MSAYIGKGRLKLLACATAFPGEAVSNQYLLQQLEKFCGKATARKAGIIAKRLGIEQRYLCRSLEHAISKPLVDAPALAQIAIEKALGQCDEPFEPGYLISHTATPHTLLPSNAAWIADRIKLTAPYMELRQACTGFASALQIALPMLNHDADMKPICIVGSEVGSVFFKLSPDFIDTEQLINYVQMGDGAAAVMLARDDGSNRHIISHCYTGHIGIDKEPGFQLSGGGSGDPYCEKGLPSFSHAAKNVKQNGPELFLKGIETITACGFELDQFAYILPHQANGHIDRLLAKYLGIEQARIINDAKTWGNLGSVAIWASLSKLIHSGKLKTGDQVLVLGAEATKYMYGGFVYRH